MPGSERDFLSGPRPRKRILSWIDGHHDVGEPNKRARPLHDLSRRSLVNLFSDALFPVQQTLCKYLDIQDIVNLTRTCKALESLYRRLLSTQWNIEKQLGRIFRNPRLFRNLLLGQCNALIYGSFALQFFQRAECATTDLDIYIHESRDDVSHLYLTVNEGYKLLEERQAGLPHRSDIVSKRIYSRADDQPSPMVRVLITDTNPATALLRDVYLTATVNIITYNKAYAMFPRSAFVKKQAFILKAMDTHFGRVLRNYKTSGWTSQRLLESHLNKRAKERLERDRWVGDKKYWTITLEPAVDIMQSPAPSVIECCNFRVERWNAHHTSSIETMHTLEIRCWAFRHPTLLHE